MLKRKTRLLSAVIAMSLCAASILFQQSHVQAANGLTISPPLKEITIGPGLLEATTDVTLQNNTTEPITAHLQLVDLKALGQFGGTSLDKANLPDKYDLATWMTLPGGDTVVIAKGETVRVRINITNRQDLSPGGHYGAVIINTSNLSAVSSNVNISQQLVSLLFVKKLGGEVFRLELEPFNVKGSTVPQEVTARFKSTGNVHVVPRGYIEVTDPAGKLVAKGILNQDSNMILPGTTRQFVILMQPVAAASKSGRYKVTIHYRYDGQSDFSEQSTYFTRGLSTAGIVISLTATGVIIITLVLYSRWKNRTWYSRFN